MVSIRLLEYGLNHELQETEDGHLVISPYVTMWAEGNYYILAKREGSDLLEHFRIDHMKDITLLERGVDMIFGGFNPSQYARQMIFQKGEDKERFEIECDLKMWQEIAERFGKDAVIVRKGFSSITVKITAIPSEVKTWVMNHLKDCEIISPKKFREEIQMNIMDAYKKYCT